MRKNNRAPIKSNQTYLQLDRCNFPIGLIKGEDLLMYSSKLIRKKKKEMNYDDGIRFFWDGLQLYWEYKGKVNLPPFLIAEFVEIDWVDT